MNFRDCSHDRSGCGVLVFGILSKDLFITGESATHFVLFQKSFKLK